MPRFLKISLLTLVILSAFTVNSWAQSVADLVITSGSPTVTPSSVAPGGTILLSSWTVKNQGTASSGYFENGFYLSADSTITSSDTYLDGNANTSLETGAQFTWGGPDLVIPASTSPGTYYVGILVDKNNQVTESNETNNYVSRQITVTASTTCSTWADVVAKYQEYKNGDATFREVIECFKERREHRMDE